ncbi:MAG: DUF2220 family protein [Eubacteriales bacterium]|nr:DUF2220 family protein [Eubacteriales bacterium]
MTLLERLLIWNERTGKGRLEAHTGRRKWTPTQKDLDEVGRQAFLRQARELEEQGLLAVKWHDFRSEIEYIWYETRNLPLFYQMTGRPRPLLEIRNWQSRIAERLPGLKKDWIRVYDLHAEKMLKEGTVPAELKKHPDLLACLDALDSLEEPVYKRVFSTQVFKNSKYFEQELEKTVVSLVRQYCSEAVDAMEDFHILELIFLEEYAQQLYLKGDLELLLDGRRISLGAFPYGFVLNSQMLKRAEILPGQKLRRVVSIENKANFEAAAFEEGVLLLYSHGFFGPKEGAFLVRLRERLLLDGNEVQYLHSSDLDFGGVRIFQHIRRTIFPEVRPLRMDAGTYWKYRKKGYGIPVGEDALKKLKGIEEPLLKELIQCLLEEKMGIEQECFLVSEGN